MEKRPLAMLLAACLVMSMVIACGSSAGTSAPPPAATQSQAPATAAPATIAPTTAAPATIAPTTTAPQVAKPEAATPQASANAGEQTTVVFTDSAGRKVEVPKNITRIASSGPLAQMVIFALAPEKFVGLAGSWLPEAEQFITTEYYHLPVLGQLYGTSSSTLNLEEIARVGPQVVIDIGEAKATIVEDMDKIQQQLGIPAVHIGATTKTMPDAYRKLGQLLGKEKDAEVLAQYLEKVYSDTLKIVNTVGESGKARLLYCLGDKGINVIAKNSYHAEVIDLVGNNVAVVENPSSKGTGNEVDMEQILLWDPDVILFAPDSIYGTVASNATWQNISAIKNKKYYEVPSAPYNWMGFPPSINRYMGLIWVTELLYPEVADYDVHKEAVKYYELFYHGKLTDAQFNTLVANSLGRADVTSE